MHNATYPLSPDCVGGEGWGEGAAPRTADSLQKRDVLPPHPTLSPKRGWGRGVASLMLILLWTLLSLSAFAQNPDPGAPVPGTTLDVSLITFGPGTEVWERFGHNAIMIHDRRTSTSRLYNYGIFDFDQKDFFLNFARGRMTYRMAVGDATEELPYYIEEGRWIVQQELALTPAQKSKLANFLDWNVRPENQQYRYNYFEANCSTKTRDALDMAADGAIRAQTISPSRGFTYRMDVMRVMRPDPLLMVGMDAGLGPYADRRLTYWNESFLPTELMRHMREVFAVDPTTGERHSLVARETRLNDSRIPEPSETPPNWLWGALAVGIALALLILALARARANAFARVTLATLGVVIDLVLGVGGLVLLALWFLTDHTSAWRNENLFLLDPLCLLLIPIWIGAFRRRWSPSPFARYTTLFIALIAGVAWFAKVFPWFIQDNKFWIALLLPVHVAFALAVWMRAGRPAEFSNLS